MKSLWLSRLLSLSVYFFCPPGNDGYTAIFHHSIVFLGLAANHLYLELADIFLKVCKSIQV